MVKVRANYRATVRTRGNGASKHAPPPGRRKEPSGINSVSARMQSDFRSLARVYGCYVRKRERMLDSAVKEGRL